MADHPAAAGPARPAGGDPLEGEGLEGGDVRRLLTEPVEPRPDGEPAVAAVHARVLAGEARTRVLGPDAAARLGEPIASAYYSGQPHPCEKGGRI